jgi:hypothetical protein
MEHDDASGVPPGSVAIILQLADRRCTHCAGGPPHRCIRKPRHGAIDVKNVSLPSYWSLIIARRKAVRAPLVRGLWRRSDVVRFAPPRGRPGDRESGPSARARVYTRRHGGRAGALSKPAACRGDPLGEYQISRRSTSVDAVLVWA